MRRASVKPEATQLTTKYQVHQSQRWNSGMHGDKITSPNWLKMFEKHQHKEQFFKDMSQKQEIIKDQRGITTITRWHEPNRDLRTLREFCKTSMSWLQCLFRNRDHLLQLREKFEVLAESYNIAEDQLQFYFNPGFVIKNSSRGPKHGARERQVLFYRAKEMPKKTRQAEHGNHPTIFSSWYALEGYRKSLAEHNIGEKEVMLVDRIALERHDCSASRAERLQNAKHWIPRLIADVPQKPPRQRPEFAVTLKQCFEMQDAHLAETQQSLRPISSENQQRQREDQQFEGGENFDYYVVRKNWMAVLQRATRKPVGSVFIFSFAVARLTMANELELMVFHIIW